jgi:hypothetical protein
MRRVFIVYLHTLILHEGERCDCHGQVFLGPFPLQLIDLRVEHQGKGFMGCDYNIDETYIKVKVRRESTV